MALRTRRLNSRSTPDSALANAFPAGSVNRTESANLRSMADRLSSLLDPTRITLHVTSAKRTAALNEVARLLEGHAGVTNFQGFYN